jgi:hypothetical protein
LSILPMMPDGTSFLHVLNIPRPPSRPRGATPPKLVVINALETTPLLQEITTGTLSTDLQK